MPGDIFRPEYNGEQDYEKWSLYKAILSPVVMLFVVIFIPTLIYGDDPSVKFFVFVLYAAIALGVPYIFEMVMQYQGDQHRKIREWARQMAGEGELFQGETIGVIEITHTRGSANENALTGYSEHTCWAFRVTCNEFDDIPEAFKTHKSICDVFVLNGKAYCNEFRLTEATFHEENGKITTRKEWEENHL